MDHRPIGVFDSGLGGLTAVSEILRLNPNAQIVYFGDTGRVPYGTRSSDTIIRYTRQTIRFLKQFHIQALLIACGTASSVALDTVAPEESFPILGVVESTARAAVEATKNQRIGIIGTAATIQSGSYESRIRALCPGAQTFAQACPLFVPLVENGRVSPDDRILKLAVEEALTPLRAQQIDTLILGCTHYPIIAEAIGAFMGAHVKLINSGREAARALTALPGLNPGNHTPRNLSFYVSDDALSFARQASLFLGEEIRDQVQLVQIEEY